MKYVLDTSVAFKWVVAGAHADKAIRLREDYRNGVHELLAPDIFPPRLPTLCWWPSEGGGSGQGNFPYFWSMS